MRPLEKITNIGFRKFVFLYAVMQFFTSSYSYADSYEGGIHWKMERMFNYASLNHNYTFQTGTVTLPSKEKMKPIPKIKSGIQFVDRRPYGLSDKDTFILFLCRNNPSTGKCDQITKYWDNGLDTTLDGYEVYDGADDSITKGDHEKIFLATFDKAYKNTPVVRANPTIR